LFCAQNDIMHALTTSCVFTVPLSVQSHLAIACTGALIL
jgi:hypothetical protein